MTYAVLGLGLLIVAAIALLAMRGKKPTGSTALPSEPAVPAAPVARTASAVDAGTAPAPELKLVSCTVGHGVHGAMPPFGRLRSSDQGLVFEASSRVMAASTAGFASGDGASTMQSVGSVEMGQFRFDVPRADIQGIDIEGPKVVIRTSAETFSFEGIGSSGKQLLPWLRDHGFSV
jgi:hypothetical protein